jgi:GDPmannose 4,6-dehydratase
MQKTAFITGITGQDGAYLSKLLIDKGYKLIGLVRNVPHANTTGLAYLGIDKDVILEECDLLDITQIMKLFNQYRPTEIYNLAAQSSVSVSFSQPIGTIQFNTISVLNILEAIRIVNADIKFYQASSSEMYGRVLDLPITEKTVFHPLSPYAISKASAHWITVNYREAYDLFACCGVLFNHESYLRSGNFFVKKVIRDCIAIHYKQKEFLEVGNIQIKRDFGYAPKYVEAMWLMLQQERADDYLICSGKSVSLESIILHTFNRFQIPQDRLLIKESLFRPTEIEDNYGVAYKANVKLNWIYNYDFYTVLDLIIEEELRHFKK